MKILKSAATLLTIFFLYSPFVQAQDEENNEPKNDENKLGILSEGIRAFSENKKMGFMDERGNIIHPAEFDYDENSGLPYFSEGLCLFYEKKGSNDYEYKFGFINRNFKKVIPAIYSYEFYCDGFPTVFRGGKVVVPLGKKTGYKFTIINKSGGQISKPFHSDIVCTAACIFYPEISEGYLVSNNGRTYGYINATDGKLAIPYRFTHAGPFSEGLAAVVVDNKYIIFIDKKGNQKIDKRFYIVNKNMPKRDDVKNQLYTANYGCENLGGFVNGKMLINYYDNDGAGPEVFALIDKNGNVLIKKPQKDNESINEAEDNDFKDYIWKFYQH